MRVVGRRPLTRASVESSLGNHGLSLTLGLLLVAANALLFTWGAHDEASHHTNYRWWVMSIARGAGYALNLDTGLALLLACRAGVGAARSSRLSAVIPLDALFPAAHAAVGVAIAVFVVVHAAFHLGWIVKDNAWAPGAWGITWCVSSGVVLTTVLAVLLATASRQVRRAKYHLFYRAHLVCAAAFYPLLLVHGVYYGAPYTYKWIVGPMAVYVLDRAYRLATQRKLSTAATLTPLPGGVVRVTIPRGGVSGVDGARRFPYEAGAYAKVRVKDINSQWHPFTIASAPHEPDLVLYVKTGAGDWTGALGEMAGRADGAPVAVAMDVKGPYGALHMTRFTHVLLISGGVGGTPFASLVKDVHHRIALAAGDGTAATDGGCAVADTDGAHSRGNKPSAAGVPADDAPEAGETETPDEAQRRATRIAYIRSTLSAQVSAALSARPDEAERTVLTTPRLRVTPEGSGPVGQGAGRTDGEAAAGEEAAEEEEDEADSARLHDAEAHLGGAVADAAAAAAAAAAAEATADALVSPPRRPRAGVSPVEADSYASPGGRALSAWGGGPTSTTNARGGHKPGSSIPWSSDSPCAGASGTVTSWGEHADAALEEDDGDAAKDDRVAQLSHALFSPPWRVVGPSWSSTGLSGWHEPEVVVHSPTGGPAAPPAGEAAPPPAEGTALPPVGETAPSPAGRDASPTGAPTATAAAERPPSTPDRELPDRRGGEQVGGVSSSPLRTRLSSRLVAALPLTRTGGAGRFTPTAQGGVAPSPRRPPPAVVRSPRRTLERIGVSFGRSPTAAAAAATASAAAGAAVGTAAGRSGGGRRRGRHSLRTPRLCASPADGSGGVVTPNTLSPVGSSSTVSPLSATNVLDSPLGGRADAPPPSVAAGVDAPAVAMAEAITVPPLVRRPPPKYRAMLALDSVTVNFLLLWLLLARFCVALLACIFRLMAPMDGSTAPGFVSASATALYEHRELVVADLVLALALALPITVAVALEAHELGFNGMLSSAGAVVDAVLLLPLAWLGVVIDVAALAGVPSAVSVAPLNGSGQIFGDVGTVRPWLFGVTFGVAWPALTILLGLRLFRVLGARVLLAQNWRRTNEPTRALDFVWTAPAASGDEWLRREVGGLLGSPHVRLHRFVTRSGKEADEQALAAELKVGGREPKAAAASPAADEGGRSVTAPGADRADAYVPLGFSPTRPSAEASSTSGSPDGSAPASPLGATPADGSSGGAAGTAAKEAASAAAASTADWTTASHYGRPDWEALLATIAERATSRTVLGIFFCGPAPMAEAVRRAASRAMCESKVRGLVLAGLLHDGRLDDVDRRTLRGVTATGLDVRFVMHVESF